jgi:hypothetical protein
MVQVVEQPPQVGQGLERDAWLANLHAAAVQGIKHPARERPDPVTFNGGVGPMLDVLHAAVSAV